MVKREGKGNPATRVLAFKFQWNNLNAECYNVIPTLEDSKKRRDMKFHFTLLFGRFRDFRIQFIQKIENQG